MTSKKNIFVFGSFDLLHPGHLFFLQKTRDFGEYLTVVLARDEEILHFKDRLPARTYDRRKADLLATGLVEDVICSDLEHGSFGVLQNHKADVIVLGDGQEELGHALACFFQQYPQFHCPIHKVPPMRRFFLSSTRLHQLRQYGIYGLLIAAMVFWASSWVSGKLIAVNGFSAPFATVLRMNMLAIIFLIWNLLGVNWRNLKSSLSLTFQISKNNLISIFVSSLALLVYNLCFFYGLQYSYANQAGILTSILIPIFSSLIHRIFQKETFRYRQIIGLILGVGSGLILMGLLPILQQYFWPEQPVVEKGSLLIHMSFFVLAALAWSIVTLCSNSVQKTCTLQKYSFYLYFSTSIISLWGWFYTSGSFFWLPILAIVVLGSVMGTSLYFFALRFLRPHIVAGFLFLNPIFILLMSWWLLGEPWNWELSIGSILAILGIILLNSPGKPNGILLKNRNLP